MKKIRRGNDFVFAWEIERNGLPEDLSSVLEKHLYLSALGKRVELVEGVDYDITGNVIRIEVTPAIANILGTYKAEFHYILPDIGLIDEDRKCAVDVEAFVIVGSTAQADDPSEFTVTSDMAIAFKGDKGDSSYQTWLDAGNTGTEADYLAWIQKPATDIEQIVSANETARVSAEGTRQNNETARINAETLRNGAESTRKTNEINRINAEELRVTEETSRVNAEGLRAEAETARNTAEGERQTNTATAILQANTARDLANEKAGLAATATTEANTARDEANLAATAANTKAGEANTAAMAANTAAGLADTARLAIQSDLALKADETDLVQLAGEVEQNSYVKITNLVTNGNFSNGSDKWSVIGQGTASYSNNLATITGTGTGNVNFVQDTIHKASPNDKIYVKAKRKRIVGEQVLFIRFESLSGGQVTAIQISSTFGEYSYDSVLATLSGGYVEGNLKFVYQHYHGSGVSNLGTSSELGNIVVVNLTKTFGAGNEPTKEEMDLLISTLGIDYFEGEITIPAQKVMQWQLALIRKNKNAIIALGGTII